MAPRRYSMDRRRESLEATRQRILEATLALHAERGIFGTSWRDIAERADVAATTVYKHFPSLDELVPACGAHIALMTAPPSRDEFVRIFGGADASSAERLGRVVDELCGFYRRAEPYLELDARERMLPAVRDWEEEARATRESLIREALRDREPGAGTVRVVAAMLDFPVYLSLVRHEVPRERVATTITGMLLRWLALDDRD
jgi:AcrR family transcriptional regulator